MHCLYECGSCGHTYEFPMDKLASQIKKIVCPNCKNHHFFGQSAKSDLPAPMMESIHTSLSKMFSQDIDVPALQGSMFWQCGTCASDYEFPKSKISFSGTKITCLRCFHYFVLQRIKAAFDLQSIQIQDFSKEGAASATVPYDGAPPEIEEKEVSVRVNFSTLLTDEIRSPMEEITMSEAATRPKVVSAVSKPESKQEKIPSPAVSASHLLDQTPAIQPSIQPAPMFKEADTNILNSFAHLQTAKPRFKIDEALQSTHVAFNEHDIVKNKNPLEKNMIAISLWVIGISIVAFAAISGYEWYRDRNKQQAIEKIEQEVEAKEPGKPKYGFPELGE